MPKREELATLVDMAAKAAGSQAEAARRVGIRPQHLNDYKKGRMEPSPETVASLAHVAGLDPVAWLARGTMWRAEGKPYEATLKEALKGALQAIGGVLAMSFPAALFVESWLDVPRCIRS